LKRKLFLFGLEITNRFLSGKLLQHGAKPMLTSFLRVALVSSTLASLAACVSPTAGVPHAFHTMGGPLTADVAISQEKAQPHCELVARETTPSHTQAAATAFWNHGVVGGGLSVPLGYWGYSNITGTALRTAGIVGNTALTVVTAGTQSAISRWESVDDSIWGKTDNCLLLRIEGINSFAPSEAQAVKKDPSHPIQPDSPVLARGGRAYSPPPN
jgi:hypothetical protein